MTRVRIQQEGSLELLLDTICNTFGGVLFISILVVVLLNMAGQKVTEDPPDAQTQAKLVDAQINLDQRQAEIRKLRAALSPFQYIEDESDSEALRKLLADLRATEAERAAAIEKRNQMLNEMSKLQIKTNDTLSEAKQIREQREKLQRQLAAVQKQVTLEKAKRSRETKPGTTRKTGKQEIVTFLRQGRFCSYGSIDSSGNLVPNPAEYTQQQDEVGTYIEPRPSGGIVVNTSGGNSSVRRKLTRFNRNKYYLAIYVWPDSFSHFAPLKDILLKEKYEYRLVPMDIDQKIYIGTSRDPSAGEVQGG